MPVLIDSRNFTQRIRNMDDAIFNDGKAIDDGIKRGLDRAKEVIFAAVVDNPETYRQVGFSLQQFARNISKTFRTGRHAFGIFDTDIVGDEEDIEEIFGIPGLWHMGTARFDIFEARVLNNEALREFVEEGRLDYWGDKTPQWIFLNFGFEAVLGDIPSIAGVEPTGFVVEGTPGNFIQAGIRSARQASVFAVEQNMLKVFRSPDGRFIKDPTAKSDLKTKFGNE